MKRFLKKLAAAGMALLMVGCSKMPEPEVIDGGITDYTNPEAPKWIESTEITGFSAAFYLAERWAMQICDVFAEWFHEKGIMEEFSE